MVRTRVGYAGGTTDNPTYYNLGNHSETVQIDYDPAVISYGELLDVFWQSHTPTLPSWTDQYRSIIFYHNEEQQRLATESLERRRAELGRPIYTEIRPFERFYLAEDSHQKYYLWGELVLRRDLSLIYPDIGDFIASTAVARVNGYAGGYGTPETLEAEIDKLGLSEAGKDRLREIAASGLTPGCAVP